MSVLTKAIPADKQPRAPAWRLLHEAADAVVRPMMRDFLAFIEDAKDGMDLRILEEAIEARDVVAAENAVPIDQERLNAAMSARLSTVFTSAGRDSVQFLESLRKAAAIIEFDGTNPRSIDFARNRSAELVTGVTAETRAAIREFVARGFEEGIPPRALARELRAVIGLTRQQALAVINLRRNLAAQGLGHERIRELGNRQAGRFLRQRAETIARTETIQAANEGQQELFRQAQEQGLLDEQRTRRKWLVTPDARLCPICAPIPSANREGVGLQQPFQTPVGMRMVPPAHPRCRCAVGLTFMRGN